MAKENEIVLFETEDAKVRLTVSIQEDTVWLTQAQMTELFDTSKQNISLHINNCFKEGELDKGSVVKDFLTTASDGKNYKTKYYNLDMIISVGYRVKSRRGIEFRRWANKVLKDYIIKGYAVNDKRLEALQRTVESCQSFVFHDKRSSFRRWLQKNSGIIVLGVFEPQQCTFQRRT